jgi:molybdopterin molybdotransferase
MLSVADAQALVLEKTRPLHPSATPLTPYALGLVLAEDVASDRDAPPFDKALMDGYAVRAADVPDGKGTLTIIEEITAGRLPQKPLGAGQASRIMTGAAIPNGADAVVIVERTQLYGDHVRIEDRACEPGQNILRRGREMRRDEVVLKPGAVLRPQEMGLLASVGRTSVQAHPAPVVAVLATGDELVDAGSSPGPGQIRNSNGPMLLAQVCRAGGQPRCLGIARDRRDELSKLIAEGLSSHVLVLSGGVSAGKLDLVPGVLQELGVQSHFHHVRMKPGKPVFFGTKAHTDRSATLVFGLPGNPVSSLVCFELFVRPALRKLAGHAEPGPRWVQAALSEDFRHRSDRPTYHPAQLAMGPQGWRVRPQKWFGSSDLRGLLSGNALVLFSAGEQEYRVGESLPALGLDS